VPIYEFRCRRCESRFEALRPMGDDGRDLECPDCGEKAPDRQVSTFATGGGCGSPTPGGSGFG
jgi:putative FmdB family regulatory protein